MANLDACGIFGTRPWPPRDSDRGPRTGFEGRRQPPLHRRRVKATQRVARSSMVLGKPPVRVVTLGTPNAAASHTTMGEHSARLGSIRKWLRRNSIANLTRSCRTARSRSPMTSTLIGRPWTIPLCVPRFVKAISNRFSNHVTVSHQSLTGSITPYLTLRRGQASG